jgi:chromate transporter
MVLFALGIGQGRLNSPVGAGAIHGLKLAAVAVVAQAVWGMARTLAPDRRRASLALLALVAVTVAGSGLGQLAALAGGALIGAVILSDLQRSNASDPSSGTLRLPVSPAVGIACLTAFSVLLLTPPILLQIAHIRPIEAAYAFYQTGALVFGGGHVVLPLLQAKVVQPGWVDPGQFLTGYALAQAIPGPLFTFAAYLGAILRPGPNGVGGAVLALVAIFLPGLLLLVGVAPFWNRLRANRRAQAVIAGANAAVVGILAAALYNPVWISAVATPLDLAIAAVSFVGLVTWRAPPIAIVGFCAVLGAISGVFHSAGFQ